MQIGDQLLFKGYSGNTADYEPILAPGDACVVQMIDGDTGLRVRKVPDHPSKTVSEWVLVEEVMETRQSRRRNDPRIDPQDVLKIMGRKGTKEYRDLRARAAYMHVTGAHPTHLRPFFTGALNVISETFNKSGRFGPFLIDRSAVYELELNSHPMVRRTRQLLHDNWRLVVSLGPNSRRSYQALYFSRGRQRLTLNGDGSTKPGWPPRSGRSTRH